MTAQTVPYLKFVAFSDLKFWDVKRYYSKNKLSFEQTAKLSDILVPYRRPVSKLELLGNSWQIIAKINFAGELFLRDIQGLNDYKGSVNLVPDHSIIYSKINVRHGCIYYHGKGKIPFAVSSEYPVFTFDDTVVNGMFLHKILRSQAFRRLLNTKTTGISKARVKQSEFLDIEIPLPSLAEQEQIMASYEEKISQARALKADTGSIEQQIAKYIQDSLGYQKIKELKTLTKGFLNVIDFVNLEKWGAGQNSRDKIGLTKTFIIKKIKEICIVSSGGTPSRTRKEFYQGNIPWIKTGEVVNEVIYDSEEKITEEAVANSSAKLYPKGSLIIAMYGQGLTRGRTAKLGIPATTNQACAVLYQIDNEIILTDYLWIYLMGEYHRLRALASGNSQPNLNAQMIKDYPVIIPPITLQKDIIENYAALRNKVQNIHLKAQELISSAEEAFEKAIFN